MRIYPGYARATRHLSHQALTFLRYRIKLEKAIETFELNVYMLPVCDFKDLIEVLL